ncbi:hypothetical protein QBZ16_001366 [Prototheca wickerhamii]|uniref:valine--tRNA ligase n=1 Tax=Prototheca wickerhamii TaxID=3111 RepID=A0AAD9IF90_PROWI|nr:hypothetical protein QBZ16_001366 [Prototheca wickerhamii]
MPPPNVTGKLHMGHAMFVTLQDALARFHRLRGRPVLWLPGTDHAGIATQMTVERALEAEGLTREGLGREAFVARAWAWKAARGGEITRQLRRLGASCDWGRERFTLDAGSCAAVNAAFARLHARGLVYRGAHLVNWSPGLRTAVSDLEVEYAEEPGTMFTFRYPLADGRPDDFLPVATTRPETIVGDAAVAVHPEDARYARFVGRRVRVPLVGREVPVIADAYVDRDFGTGALKITPGHDVNDYELGKKHGLPIINIMRDDGSLNERAGPLAGLTREAARLRAWGERCARRGWPSARPSTSCACRARSAAARALASLDAGETRILPDRFAKVYRRWLENIRDWCVSRQLWWGHRIPVWYVYKSEGDAERGPGPGQAYVVAEDERAARAAATAAHGRHVVLRQETDVLDTWFSSGLWPFSTLGWPDEGAADLRRFYPTTLLETGHDILFFWVARMAMLGLELTGRAPFRDVYLHGLVRDAQGRKMSKTLGNVVDPVTVCDDYGTDALRLTLATGTAPGQDLNLSLDRVTAARNFTNKLWNAGKFVLHALRDAGDEEWAALADAEARLDGVRETLPLAERWALEALDRAVCAATAAAERYDLAEAGRVVQEFVWGDFADWYIEAAKTRLYSDRDQMAKEQTRLVLTHIYTATLKLAHPLCPFITEELWGYFPAAQRQPALITASWPRAAADTGATSDVAAFERLQAAVRLVRNCRAEYGVEPGRRVAATTKVADPQLRAALESEADVIALLAKLDADKLTFEDLAPTDASVSPGQSVTLVVAEGLEVTLPLAGLFDVAKETARLSKQAAKLEREVQGLTARLGHKGFAQRAPRQVIEEVERNLQEASQQLEQVRAKLQALPSAS